MDKNIASRIVEIRREVGLTQTEFAERLITTRAKIASYELARVNFDESFLSLICKEFSVNYEWLRTGIGEKRPMTIEDEFESVAKKHDFDELDRIIFKEYIKLNKMQREVVKKLIINIADAHRLSELSKEGLSPEGISTAIEIIGKTSDELTVTTSELPSLIESELLNESPNSKLIGK